MKLWLQRIAITFAALLLLVAATLWWLLGTGAGLRFALARAQAATHGALQIRQVQGRLVGPLDLAGLRYDDGHGTMVSVAKAHLELRFWPLLTRRLHLLDLDADGVEVALPKSTPPSEHATAFSLTPPLDLQLDRVHVGTVKVTQDGQPLFASDRLDLSGSWTHAGLQLKQLALQAPQGHVDLSGTLALGHAYRGDSQVSFAWKVGDTDYAGALVAHSDGARTHVALALARPTAAQLQLDLAQSSDHAWTAKLDAPRFDPKPLLGDSSLTSVAIAVQGHGDRHGGTLTGRLDLNDHPLLLQPLRAQFSNDYNTLTLQQLSLGSPQIKGQLEASGTMQLDARPLRGDLNIRWNDLLLPPELVGQTLASHGNLHVNGSAARYQAEGQLDIGPPGKLATLALDLDGTPQQINLHTLALQQPQGNLRTSGTLTLQPVLAWQVEASAKQFDPGQLFAGWNGALDADITSTGTLPSLGPDATLEIRKLNGKLRERKVSGTGKLHLSPNHVIDGQLELASGGSTAQVIAKGIDLGSRGSNSIDVKLAIASLGDWLPDANGRLNGEFRIRGIYPKLGINGQLDGQSLAYQQQHIDHLKLTADVPDIDHPGGKLALEATGVNANGLLFQQLNLLGDGTAAQHRLSINARGTQLSGRMLLTGTQQGSRWRGTLSTLTLQPQGLPDWRLQQPVQLSYNDGAMSLSELCLSAGDPQLCVTAKQDKPGNLDASYRLRALPLALLLNAAGDADLPIRADGTLEGSGKFRRSTAGALSGTASLTSARGNVTYTDRADAPLLRYDQLSVDANLSPASQHITVHTGLDDGGRLDGQITLSGAQQSLGGQLDVHLGNLAFIELFSNDVANVKGALNGSFRFAGTLQQPAISGQASVADFATELPSAGLKLEHGQLVVSTSDTRQFRIDGSVQSGKGTLAIAGSAGIGASAQTTLTLKGSQFTAVDIPAARVVLSPDMVLKQDASGIALGGAVTLDSASIDLQRLPGAGATQASSDVVLIDDPQQRQVAARMPLSARVKVDLGNKTHLTGKGLDGNLTGVLTVIEQPGRETLGQGQVAVTGTYHAYGQDLHIERGQLLFASTPIDNPGLNLRAVRTLTPNATIDEGQEVGLLVSGTAQRPILTVFSSPLMEQSDALSYLITGKPLSDVSSGEGDMVGAAAQALGSAAGNLLAKSIGTKLGVDDISVSSNAALGGNSAFTVGKYLSPRLYLSYGVGLFEPGQVVTLRYRLGHRWNLEAQSATDFNRASLNYRIEK